MEMKTKKKAPGNKRLKIDRVREFFVLDAWDAPKQSRYHIIADRKGYKRNHISAEKRMATCPDFDSANLIWNALYFAQVNRDQFNKFYRRMV